MARHLVSLVVGLVLAGVAIAGCSQAAPAPTAPPAPTKAAEPAKPAAPTAAPVAQPTAAPAPKVSFPEKGRAVTIVVPWAAGGGADITGRVVATLLEKELGIPVQVVNKAGAASQIGATEIANAKPDGYTLGLTVLPGTITVYLEPERKAVFNRKSFVPVAQHTVDPIVIGVPTSSPFKTLKDLVDYAKANPMKLKAGTGGILSVPHLAELQLQKEAGIKFTIVHFTGGADQLTNMMGGHTDMIFDFPIVIMPQAKAGKIRPLAVMDKKESKFLPGVKTLESMGYKGYSFTSRVYTLPAGTPMDIANLCSDAFKKIMATEEHNKKMDELGTESRHMGPAEAAAYWEQLEKEIAPLMELAKQESK